MDLYFCPICDKEIEPEYAIFPRKYSPRALTIPWFICGKCRIIDVDNNLIKRTIRIYCKDFENSKLIFQEIYKIVKPWMDKNITQEFIFRLSYKRMKFIRKEVKE